MPYIFFARTEKGDRLRDELQKTLLKNNPT